MKVRALVDIYVENSFRFADAEFEVSPDKFDSNVMVPLAGHQPPPPRPVVESRVFAPPPPDDGADLLA